ncbi:MAG: glycosyltransferase [Rhizobiaceae bacterium]|nr:glycosyltransferase [Rhizobiaceae bacterium]MCV0405866.1 glycosyltransferase [Rhizobiaceae bacterium]
MLEADVKLAQQYSKFWRDVFSRLELAVGAVDELDGRASRNGTDILSELRASGKVADRILYRAIAAEIGIEAEETVDPKRIEASETTCVKLLGNRTEIAAIRYSMRSLDMGVMLSPWRLSTGGLAKMNARGEVIKSRSKLVSPRVLRTALAERARDLLSRIACSGLAERWPRFSARTVAVAWQGAFFGALAISLMVGLIQARGATMVAIHVVASLLFLSCVLLRCLAALEARPPAPIEPERRLTPDMPTYTIVVALYREAAIVPDLLAALGKIFWPRSKLEVKLVCEEDDHATLGALEALPLRPVIEIIRVPPVGPRTKPKALAYALPFCSGEFLALYDAEDRPHPMQLVEAWEAFRKADGDLACVQAPLVVANSRESMVARSFAFEYAALFRGLLPWLANRNLVLPLGGTSNHFRRETLEEVGGWDPYNVTEDADLGLRLGRFGYRTGLIELPTLEEGPHRWPIWLRQRTRWFKGWMHTRCNCPKTLELYENWRNYAAQRKHIATA